MPTELLDLADTAVKVGLGALISGASTYYVTRFKQSQEADKDYRQRRWELLESSLESATAYMLELSNLYATLEGLRRDHPAATSIEATGERAFVDQRSEALQDAVVHRNRAFSRLTLVGEAKAASNLVKLNELEDIIRSRVIFQGDLPAADELADWYSRIKEAREALLRELSKNYRASR